MLKKILITSALVFAFASPLYAAPSDNASKETRREMHHETKDSGKHQPNKQKPSKHKSGNHKPSDHKSGNHTPGNHAKKAPHNMRDVEHQNRVKEHKGAAKNHAGEAAKRDAERHVHPDAE